jgi:hypothetical protein
MILIALIAVPLVVPRLIERRRASFTRLARYHAQAANYLIEGPAGGIIAFEDPIPDADAVIEARYRARGQKTWLAKAASDFHLSLAEKYAKAATRPWLPVAADPERPPMSYPRFEFDPEQRMYEETDFGFR